MWIVIPGDTWYFQLILKLRRVLMLQLQLDSLYIIQYNSTSLYIYDYYFYRYLLREIQMKFYTKC